MSTPWPRTAEFTDGRLRRLGGVAVEDLVGDHGTPLYVLDHAELVGRMRAYRAAFGPEVGIAYASKALCAVGVLRIAVAEGLDVDVASLGELATAARAGVPGERIVLHGNNKSVEELATALELGVGRIVVDSHDELTRMHDLVGAQTAARPAVLLRVSPGVGAGAHEHIRTGQTDTKFGFTRGPDGVERAVERILETDRLELRGLHCHVGSQVLDGAAYAEAVHAMVAVLAGLRDRWGIELAELDVGGGLGIPYLPEDPDPDPADYARALTDALATACAEHGIRPPRLSVEPGRSVVGPAGVTLYRVGTVKEVPAVGAFAAVDGGLSDNPRPALYDATYTFVGAGEPSGASPEAGERPYRVVGKHCESGDVLARAAVLPTDLSADDLLACAATGAYTFSMASSYNRVPRPALVLVRDGEVRTLVRRQSIQDVLAGDVVEESP